MRRRGCNKRGPGILAALAANFRERLRLRGQAVSSRAAMARAIRLVMRRVGARVTLAEAYRRAGPTP